MADLIVTFTRAVPDPPRAVQLPVVVGRSARTEVIAIAGTAADGTLAAVAGEHIVTLEAGADCWVAIGTSPDPDSTNRHPLKIGVLRPFWVELGDIVAVIER